MFSNKKKNSLPPRPIPPTPEQILNDLQNAQENDVTFLLLKQGKKIEDSSSLLSTDSEDVYTTIKTYLDLNKKLIILKDSIQEKESKLEGSVEEMKRLVQDIKEQAQAAVIR